MPATGGDVRSQFILSATVDFPDDIRHGVYNIEQLNRMMALLKGMGVSRVYWLYYGDIDPDSFLAGNMFPSTGYSGKTFDNIGEPVMAAVPIAHKHGLELYAVLKPYNTGASSSVPDGSPKASDSGFGRIGGRVQQLIPFMTRNPHTRARRRTSDYPAGLQPMPVKKIRLLKSDDSPTRVGRENLEIWTSPDNYRYQWRRVTVSVTERVERAPRDIHDFYGDLVTGRGSPVRTLTIEGLSLTDRYILVTTGFTDVEGDFRNTGLGMIEAYGDAPEPLPIVVATRSAIDRSHKDFRTYGLEFDSGFGPLQTVLDVDNASGEEGDEGRWWNRTAAGGLIAFARGKNDYLPSTPCEVYPEVRRLWSGWVSRLIDAGVDGVDVRVSHHGSLVDEPYEYGFNESVLEEYRLRYGGEPAGDSDGLRRLAELRGEHFTSFIRESSHRVRAAGKKMQVHVHTESFRPGPCHGQMMGFPANIRFDWKGWLREGLVDGITLRASWFEALESPSEEQAHRSRLSETLADPVMREALALANEMGVPVYLNRYINRAIGIDEYLADLATILGDRRFAGFDLYEWGHIARPTPDGARLVSYRGRVERIREKARELGIV